MVGACKYILSIVVMHMVSGINISLLHSTDHIMQRNKFLHVVKDLPPSDVSWVLGNSKVMHTWTPCTHK